MQTYYLALVQHGTTAIFEVADSRDQVSCECLEYYGERGTTLAGLRDRLRTTYGKVLDDLRTRYPNRFTRVAVRRVARNDYRAGHVDTVDREIADYLAGRG